MGVGGRGAGRSRERSESPPISGTLLGGGGGEDLQSTVSGATGGPHNLFV